MTNKFYHVSVATIAALCNTLNPRNNTAKK